MATALPTSPTLRALPRKLTELGRIRIGDREPNKSGKGTHQHKLETFRLTSSNSPLLHFAAGLYGGEVRPWNGEGAPMGEDGRSTHFELYTTVNSLDVLIPTFSAVEVSFEIWSASGCQRRCTGQFITHCPLETARIGAECVCPTDDHARAEAAKVGKACARILRLNVLLPDLPGMGSWRLESKGYYATAELMGTLDMLQMAGQEHSIVEAVLRLEQRSVKRPGTGEGKGTLKFAVPVLWPKYTPRQMLSSAAQRGMLLMEPVDVPRAAGVLAAHIADIIGDQSAVQDALAQARGYAGATQAAPKLRGSERPLILAAIDQAHRDHGQDEMWIGRYWVKMCKRFHVEGIAEEALSEEVLQTLLVEVQAHYATQDALQLRRDGAKEPSGPLDAAPETPGTTTGLPGDADAVLDATATWRQILRANLFALPAEGAMRDECLLALGDPEFADTRGNTLANLVADLADGMEEKG